MYHPSKNYELKQQGDGAGETSRTIAGHGVGNTRTRRTNTAKRAPKMLMHHGHGLVHVLLHLQDLYGYVNQKKITKFQGRK
jgi:hypothetical protein